MIQKLQYSPKREQLVKMLVVVPNTIFIIDAPKKDESNSLYKNCTIIGINIKIPRIICRIPSVKKTVL